MPCYTRVMVEVENTEWTKKARKELGLPETGKLSSTDAVRVRKKAGQLKLKRAAKKLDPLTTFKVVSDSIVELKMEID